MADAPGAQILLVLSERGYNVLPSHRERIARLAVATQHPRGAVRLFRLWTFEAIPSARTAADSSGAIPVKQGALPTDAFLENLGGGWDGVRKGSTPMRRSVAVVCGLLAGVAQTERAMAIELKCFCSVAMKSAIEGLRGDVGRALGQTLSVTYGTTPTTRAGIESGEAFDIAITTPAGTDELVRAGYLLAEPRVVVGVTVASIAYREGTPAPRVSDDAGLKAFVREASAISLSDPAKGGASSNFFMAALRRSGLAGDIGAKLVSTPPGEGAAPVVSGKVPYGVALTSEIAGKPGLKSVPLLPSDPAGTTKLLATVSAKGQHGDAARAFIAFLNSPAGIAARRAAGLMGGSPD